ncbi:MAG: PQ loop repeat protein [Euryarchaeota archaeon ADurb.Bin294]|jgi:MtN3 and saliva related transmembrane protein|nr:MAG: PQ loop repeat protein [Euryarchaeota archaeon ADurb.Bin294]
MSVKFIFESLGVLGSLIICGSVIPQVVRTYKTKSAKDLSIVYLIILMLGIVLLITYSVYVRDTVFILGNTLSLISVGVLIGLWKRYHRNNIYIFNRNLVHHKERRNNDVTDDNAFTGYGKSREYVQKP